MLHHKADNIFIRIFFCEMSPYQGPSECFAFLLSFQFFLQLNNWRSYWPDVFLMLHSFNMFNILVTQNKQLPSRKSGHLLFVILDIFDKCTQTSFKSLRVHYAHRH